ncbi:ankyrin repeat-containing domain protein [Chytriomyces sp. MP71]|nr:ankyrin repeat-containing domain protein [Chytriomyces sp. MP71]
MWQDEFMKDKVIFAVELAAACGNWDVTRLILARMDQKVLAKCSFALLIQRDVDLSMLFIRAGVPTTQRDAYGSNALHLACRAGDLDLVTAYVETNKFDINAKGQNDWTALHEAIGMRRFEVSKYLVRVGASLESRNNTGETPRALGSRLGLSKAELDDALSATTPTTATSFQDSNNTASPDSAGPPSPQKSHHAVIASMEKSSSGSIGRLNILDKIIRPKSGSGLAQSHTDGNRQTSSLDSMPSLATIAHSNKAAAAAAQAAQTEAARVAPSDPTEAAKVAGAWPAKSDVENIVEK